MAQCVVCQHAKVEAINAALTHGRLVAVVSTQFRVKRVDLETHLQHAPIQALASHEIDIPVLQPQVSSMLRTSAKLEAIVNVVRETHSPALVPLRGSPQEPAPPEPCACDWCRLSGYRRLLRAWGEADRLERERFCVETRTMDIPF